MCRHLDFLFILPEVCSFQHTSPVQNFVRFISGTIDSSTMLNSSDQSGHPCLFSVLGENVFHYSKYGDSVGFVHTLYQVEEVPLCSCFFLRVFTI